MAKKQPGVRFIDDFYVDGEVRYAAGQTYPETDETQRQVALGHAETVSVGVDEIQADPVAPAQVEQVATQPVDAAPGVVAQA